MRVESGAVCCDRSASTAVVSVVAVGTCVCVGGGWLICDGGWSGGCDCCDCCECCKAAVAEPPTDVKEGSWLARS